MAEREGFEPSMGYEPIHAFQACSFGRSDTSPVSRWRWPYQTHPGGRISCDRCSLPGLTGLTPVRRGGTGTATIDLETVGGDANGFATGMTDA